MLKRLIPFLLALSLPGVVLAQSTDPNDPAGLVGQLVESFKGGNWSVFASIIVLLVVWALTKMPGLSGLIKGKAKVWVAAVCGVLMAVATTVVTTGDWMAAIGSGLSVGLGATGLFELIKRKAAKQPIEDTNNDGVVDPLSK